MSKLYEEFLAELSAMAAFDAHTHLDVAHLSARGLHDILLYHMVISDLYSAGCPDGARLPEEPSEEEAAMRLERAVPYVPYIRNTGCYWLMETILRELYDWEEPVTPQNWQRLHDHIQKTGNSQQFGREVMRKAGIAKSNTELWRGRDGSCDDIFTYSLEWSFFTRAQWGIFDTALIELEHAWNHEEPCPPLPVTAREEDLRFEKKIATLADVDAALTHYLSRIPYDKIITIASHFSTHIRYGKVSKADMEKALANRANAGEWERDVYANYILEEFLCRFETIRPEMPLQFSMAAEPLPFETISVMHSQTPLELAGIIAAHPKLQFNFHISNMALNQTFCTMARELPNLSLNAYWWHNFFPSYIERLLNERLDMVAINKQVGYFSDAYTMEWSYAKVKLVRQITAKVLAERVEQGRYTKETALWLVEQLLAGTTKSLFKV